MVHEDHRDREGLRERGVPGCDEEFSLVSDPRKMKCEMETVLDENIE